MAAPKERPKPKARRDEPDAKSSGGEPKSKQKNKQTDDVFEDFFDGFFND